MSAIDKFLNEVRPWAPGVPDQTAYKHIRNAAIEFCERTRLWKFEDSYDISADDCEEISTISGSILHDVEALLFNGNQLLPKATTDLDRLMPGWRTNESGSALPQYYTQIDQGTLKIVPAMAGTLYICIRLKPSQDAMDLPDFIANEYREVIGWGALARILTMPGQSFSNPDLASFYLARFNEKLDRLSNKGTTGQQNAPKRTRASFY